MATVKINEVSPIDIETASGGHVMMQSLHRYMTQVGLTEIAITDRYDGSADGLVEQSPTVSPTKTPWMVFGFSDTAQADSPIFISFRLCFGGMGNERTGGSYSNYDSRFIQIRISTDLDESSGGAATNIIYSAGFSGFGSYNNFDNDGSLGDFIRYTGDSLTVFFGIRSVYESSVGKRSLLSFHIERQKSVDGSLSSGPAIIIDTTPWSYKVNSNHYNNFVYYDESGQDLAKSRSIATRVGDSLAYYQNGVPVVAPIFYKSTLRDELIPFRYAFAIPAATLVSSGFVLLDFEGEEKRYVHGSLVGDEGSYYFQQFRVGYSDQAVLFSWDE